MSDNGQQQEDEVMVLQSIFGDDYLEIAPGFQFELQLAVTLPCPIHVLLPSPQVTPKLLPITHLPPLQLRITYHKDYPSKHPPGFSLSSVWLATTKLSLLCEKLDELWEQSPGEVVVYNWAEFLREDTMAYLNLISDKKLMLESSDLTTSLEQNLDPRALSCYRPKMALHILRHIFEFNREVVRKEFLFGEHNCRICYTESPGKDFLHLACGDSYCGDCLSQFVSTFVTEGTIESLICPNTDCRAPLLPTDVRNCTTKELYERFERLTLQRGIEMMGDSMLKCPRCKETLVTESDKYGTDESSEFCSFAMCRVCTYPFCTKCFRLWKESTPCPTLKAKNKSALAAVLARAPSSWSQDEAGVVREYMSAVALSKMSKGCPSCGTRISKSSGCNKMTCTRCHGYFCWLCGVSIKGYDHFSDKGCPLFEGEGDVGRAVGMDENPVTFEQIMKQSALDTSHCPKCDSVNFKTGTNNLMVCWSCRFPFCFKCSEPCFGKFHFTQYGCPQNS